MRKTNRRGKNYIELSPQGMEVLSILELKTGVPKKVILSRILVELKGQIELQEEALRKLEQQKKESTE